MTTQAPSSRPVLPTADSAPASALATASEPLAIEPSPRLRLSTQYDRPMPTIGIGTCEDPTCSPRTIDSFLSDLHRHLRWHREPFGAVRDELESHVYDRARDLMLAGMSESAAVDQAIEELGDARSLAADYRRSRTIPARRFLMNASMFLLSGAVLSLSILAVSSHPGVPQSCPPTEPDSTGTSLLLRPVLSDDGQGKMFLRYSLDPAPITQLLTTQADLGEDRRVARLDIEPTQLLLSRALGAAQPDFSAQANEVKTSTFSPPSPFPADVADKRITLSIKESRLEDAIGMIAAAAGLRPIIHRESINEIGTDTDTTFSISLTDQPIDAAVRALALSASTSPHQTLTARSDGTIIEFASVAFFDQRETSLVSYDLSNINAVGSEMVQQLLQTFVEPDSWKDNGGTSAWLSFAGSKMFVQAPKRHHAHIQWFLQELQSN